MRILLVDNYDSFTYNLVQYIEENEGVILEVLKNDNPGLMELDDVDKIIISPGPGLPAENGQILPMIKKYSGKIPILGVCLGLQAIYEAFGGRLLNLQRVFHGVSSKVSVVEPGDPLFQDIGNPFTAGRYHSWVCDPQFLPPDLVVTAWDEVGEMMACRHRLHPTFGVQFHPESFLTSAGKQMISNFLTVRP